MSEDGLPTRLPVPVGKVAPVPFGAPGTGINTSINKQLLALVPDEKAIVFDVVAESTDDGERREIRGVLAGRLGDKFGAALGGQLDLDNRKNWKVEVTGVYKL